MTTRAASAQDKFDEGGASSPRSFDDFDLRLGDVMRGERATLGKSLLDVQRELRIKAGYIAAIENCDPDAFDTPGFIAGYVRSYARYLGLDPDETFAVFCEESGFSVAHGMSEKASVVNRPGGTSVQGKAQPTRDPFKQPHLPFTPASEGIFSRIEPGAVGSMLVLIALIGGIGYGGWTVLQEVQRVQVTPVDQTPVVLSDLDPVAAARPTSPESEAETAEEFVPPSNEALDRLYRPQALDVPVLVARDAPISTLDPSRVGLFAGSGQNEMPHVQTVSSATSAIEQTLADVLGGEGRSDPVFGPREDATLIAVRPAWVRITDAGGARVFEGILNAGDTFAPDTSVENPRLQVGESGALYLAVAGQTYGPVGDRGTVTSDIDLAAEAVSERFARADGSQDPDLQRVMAELERDTRFAEASTAAASDTASSVQVLETADPGVTVVAVADTWVRIRDAAGATIFETVMSAGETYEVPRTEQPPTIRSGNAGAVYFAVGGQTYGPYGSNGAIADNLALSGANVAGQMSQADPARHAALEKIVAELVPEAPENTDATDR